MDIDLFADILRSLILGSDTVNVPGLGCFMAELMPASFSDKGITVNPPYRRLYFRAQMRPEGDIFIPAVMTALHIDQESAAAKVAEFVSSFKAQLNRKKTVAIPGLGTMRATSQGDCFFIADPGLDIYPDGLGLEPVSVKFDREKAAAKPEAVHEAVPEQMEEPEEVAEAEAEAEVLTGPATELETEAETEAETVTEPAEEPEAEVSQETEAEATAESEATAEPAEKPRRRRRWVIPTAVLLFLLILVACIYIFKDIPWVDNIIDHLLYSEEEISIIKQF